jgi:signal peptidase II
LSNIKFFLAAASLILVDLFSKGYVEDFFQQGDVVNILPFLGITLAFNSGIAFSLLDFNNFFTDYVLLFIGLIITVFLVRLFKQENNITSKVGLILIISGALGNIIDRAMDGVVTDFLLFFVGNTPFFIFNLADAYISCGAVLYFGIELSNYISKKAQNE